MAEEIYTFEQLDGVRMPWNFWPRSKVEALKCVLPFSAVYSPLKQTSHLEVVPYAPVTCKECGAAVNPHSSVDFGTKMWVCGHCTTRNYFPQYYADISEQNRPSEIDERCTTIEYVLPANTVYPPIYIFIVDTSVSEDELEACKSAITQALAKMPESSFIGLITFGTHVHVHELQQSSMSKVYVFRGTGDFTPAAIASQLGFRAVARSQQAAQAAAPHNGMLATKFLVPLDEYEYAITDALEHLQPDAFPAASDHRKSRCTGAAVQVAAGMAASGLPQGVCPVRLMLFVGGPCTEGKGAIIGKELSKEIRSHKDLEKDTCEFWRPAVAFYEAIAATLVLHSHTLDVFACALEQSGLAEMKPAVQATGGLVVQTDTFRNPMFKDSLMRVFAGPGEEGFSGRCSCATLDVFTSRDIRLQGMLGCGASMQKGGASVSNNVIGAGKSSQFRLPALDTVTTLCFFFEITAEAKAAEKAKAGELFNMQFSTKYLHWDGTWRRRVTSLRRRWVSGQSTQEVMLGFDQEAAAVMMARYCTWKMESEEDFDATRWIDRALIRLCQRFGTGNKDDPTSFGLAQEMTFYPGFMFHLRRSQFVQVFGNSPDETAFARLMLFKESTQPSLTMIQPQLVRYALGEAPQPAMVDISSIVQDHILFMDAYFYIVVYHGNKIAAWRAEGYQNSPEHAAFAELLKAPQDAAMAVVRSRFPVPRVVDADNFTVAGRSQSRFLLVKLNPSATHTSNTGGEVIFTDDVSLDIFIDHLKTLAVQS